MVLCFGVCSAFANIIQQATVTVINNTPNSVTIEASLPKQLFSHVNINGARAQKTLVPGNGGRIKLALSNSDSYSGDPIDGSLVFTLLTSSKQFPEAEGRFYISLAKWGEEERNAVYFTNYPDIALSNGQYAVSVIYRTQNDNVLLINPTPKS